LQGDHGLIISCGTRRAAGSASDEDARKKAGGSEDTLHATDHTVTMIVAESVNDRTPQRRHGLVACNFQRFHVGPKVA
jgi:hypothetical protein